MSRHLFGTKVVAVWLLSWGLAVLPGFATEPAASGNVGDEGAAEALVQAALRAEFSADSGDRGELLAKALELAPDHAPAKWHSGQVEVDGQWLTVAEVERRAAADQRFTEYARLRDAHQGQPLGELALARWCRDQKLDHQAAFHWRKVLAFDRDNPEALKNLGKRWYRGRLLAADEIEEAKERLADEQDRQRHGYSEKKRWERHWNAAVTRWRTAIEKAHEDVAPSILDELNELKDPLPMMVLESVLNRPSRWLNDREGQTHLALSLKLVEVLRQLQQPWATRSLVRHAVFHPLGDVRDAAINVLSGLPREDYVPQLLVWMQSPIEAHLAVNVYRDGGSSVRQTFYREGLEADFSEVRSDSVRVAGGPPLGWSKVVREPSVKVAQPDPKSSILKRRAEAARKALKAGAKTAAKARQTHANVQEANAVTLQLNRRVRYALRRAAGVDLGENASAWHEWWRDWWHGKYELEMATQGGDSDYPYEKPVVERRYVHTDIARPKSCFPRGTLVRTLTGPVPIEEIKAGDRVLSQDHETGELAYRTVLDTTLRDPSPMIRVELGSETITTTRGHPFWVSGQGWQMAKDLRVGVPLHSVAGGVAIGKLEEAPVAETRYEFCYNLVVDGFHTYFIGDSKVLVHDNRLFVHDKTSTLVPGLSMP